VLVVTAKFAFGMSRPDVPASLQVVALTIRTTNRMELFHYTIPSRLRWDQSDRYTYDYVVNRVQDDVQNLRPEDCLLLRASAQLAIILKDLRSDSTDTLTVAAIREHIRRWCRRGRPTMARSAKEDLNADRGRSFAVVLLNIQWPPSMSSGIYTYMLPCRNDPSLSEYFHVSSTKFAKHQIT